MWKGSVGGGCLLISLQVSFDSQFSFLLLFLLEPLLLYPNLFHYERGLVMDFIVCREFTGFEFNISVFISNHQWFFFFLVWCEKYIHICVLEHQIHYNHLII
ncbi:hypothetical protein KSP39_PZI014781 [Platanthera zijinensis]|uniref:Uncharacterized protein n=1 Tax=Platanthera zijinensis TaxID=2320716 RepID=A0AAP0G2J2_9ASPA